MTKPKNSTVAYTFQGTKSSSDAADNDSSDFSCAVDAVMTDSNVDDIGKEEFSVTVSAAIADAASSPHNNAESAF